MTTFIPYKRFPFTLEKTNNYFLLQGRLKIEKGWGEGRAEE